jgi:hypothetical protein
MLVVKKSKLEEKVKTKFIGLQTGNHINWKNCTEQIMPTLSAACYAVRSTVHKSNINTVISVYCQYIHCYKILIKIFFCGNSSNSRKIFILQKKIFRFMAGAQPKTHCSSLFNPLNAELNPICHLLILLGDLTFMGTASVV